MGDAGEGRQGVPLCSSIDTQNGASRVILERDTIGHPQFCPDDDNLILYAGPLTDRVWTVTAGRYRQPSRL